eukprot:gnl/TRDRNA2_/TRDRNA2_182399_c0_seq1.p1 gnl/TRDRNA2_/TRDRNA2_182399_c0~~gnl/TRDRNA2_/TRDRNA2_182399_c0_seq1.p1  ORF type:complete len:304 (+),score=66.17 gnl/TRDRNA2_/TRDRNA2_182399_c0_seq1:61-972(+)
MLAAWAEEPTSSVLQSASVLELSGLSREKILSEVEVHKAAGGFGAVDLSLMESPLDAEIADGILDLCSAAGGAVALHLAHNDLGSGTDCEQRLYDLTGEKRIRESEKAKEEQNKRDSSKEKEFSAAAQKRRKAEEAIVVVTARLETIDEELRELERRKAQTPWFCLFSRLEERSYNAIRCLDLSNCGLHSTGLGLLTQAILELESRAEGQKISWLGLDGNELGDLAMGPLASLLRLSGALQTLTLRNVGITDRGVSEVSAGLVTNKTLALLDLRNNGLCALEAGNAALSGVKRFNHTAEILLA